MNEISNSLGRPILIPGVERSGTSLLASLINAWGAYGGDPAELEAADSGNPRGYFENHTMQVFIGSRLGMEWWEPDYAERLAKKSQDAECLQEARQLVAAMAAKAPAGGTWFWKDPMLSVTLPFWEQVCGSAVYLIPIREPFESVLSYQKLTLPPRTPKRVKIVHAYLLRWQHYMLSIMTSTRDAGPRLLVSYDRLIAAPAAECQRIYDFLTEHVGRPAGDTAAAATTVAAMVARVDPALHRNRSELPFAQRPEATPEQRALYERLCQMVDDPGLDLDPDRYPIWPGWREYITNLVVFAHVFVRADTIMRSRPVQWLVRLQGVSQALTRSVTRLWSGSRPVALRRRTYL